MAIPGLNQTALGCNSGSADPESVSYVVQLPNKSLAGNYLGMWVVWNPNSGSPTLSVADDQSQSWTNKHNVLNTAGPINLTLFEFVNTVAGVQQITVTVNGGGNVAFAQFLPFEAFNIATSSPHDITPFDNGGSTTFTTTPSPGGITTLTANDLIMTVCCEVSGAFTGGGAITTAFTPATNFKMRGTDLVFGTAMQWQAAGAAGSITSANMAITSPANGQWCCAGIALLGASAGTQASAEPYVRHRQHAAWARTGVTSLVQQFQSTANNIVVEWLGSDQAATVNAPMVTLTDNGGHNTYTRTTGAGTATGGYAQHGYVLNSTPGDVLVTTTTNTAQLSTSIFTDMQFTGAIFDKVFADNTGNQTVAGDLAVGSITPTRSGGAVFNCTSVNAGFMKNPATAGWLGTQSWGNSQTSSGNDFLDEDNGWAWIIPSSTAAQSLTYHNSQPVGGMLNWSTEFISFIGPAPNQRPIEMPLFQMKGVIGPRAIAVHQAMRNKVPLILVPSTVVDRRTIRALSRVGTRQAN